MSPIGESHRAAQDECRASGPRRALASFERRATTTHHFGITAEQGSRGDSSPTIHRHTAVWCKSAEPLPRRCRRADESHGTPGHARRAIAGCSRRTRAVAAADGDSDDHRRPTTSSRRERQKNACTVEDTRASCHRRGAQTGVEEHARSVLECVICKANCLPGRLSLERVRRRLQYYDLARARQALIERTAPVGRLRA